MVASNSARLVYYEHTFKYPKCILDIPDKVYSLSLFHPCIKSSVVINAFGELEIRGFFNSYNRSFA